MANPPHGWHPPPQSHPPPDQNGWGRYVAATLEHILVRLHYLEISHHDMKHDRHATDAPTTSPPKETSWSDRRDMVKEIGQAVKEVRVMLMWIAAIVLLGGLIAKKIDLIQLQTLKSWFGLGG